MPTPILLDTPELKELHKELVALLKKHDALEDFKEELRATQGIGLKQWFRHLYDIKELSDLFLSAFIWPEHINWIEIHEEWMEMLYENKIIEH